MWSVIIWGRVGITTRKEKIFTLEKEMFDLGSWEKFKSKCKESRKKGKK